MLTFLRNTVGYFRRATFPGGPSTTKIIYLASGWAGIVSAFLMTFTFCFVYVHRGIADPSFAGALGALWVVVSGFASHVQNNKNSADKDIAIGNAPAAAPSVKLSEG